MIAERKEPSDFILKKAYDWCANAASYWGDEHMSVAAQCVKKQIAMQPVWEGDDDQDYIDCPNCGEHLRRVDEDDYFGEPPKHCPECGQKLRW